MTCGCIKSRKNLTFKEKLNSQKAEYQSNRSFVCSYCGGLLYSFKNILKCSSCGKRRGVC